MFWPATDIVKGWRSKEMLNILSYLSNRPQFSMGDKPRGMLIEQEKNS